MELIQQIKNLFSFFQSDSGSKKEEVRNRIIEVFFESDEEMTTDRIFELVQNERGIITKSSVFRIMKELCQYNLAIQKRGPSGEVIYSHDHLTGDGAFFTCIKCAKKTPVKVNPADLYHIVSNVSAITMFNFSLDIKGLCENCRPSRISTALINIKGKKPVIVYDVQADAATAKRLSDIGIKEGVKIEIVSNINNSFIIKVNGERVSVNKNLARDIFVMSE